MATELKSLNDSMCNDDVRAIEFHPVLTQFLRAVDSFIRYRQTGDPTHVAAIAVSSMNSIDYEIDDVNYSIENMLGWPSMVAELERQRRLLTA